MKKVKPDFQHREVPPALQDLPRFGISHSRASRREQSKRGDVTFGVRSLDDLSTALKRGFADPDLQRQPPKPKAR